MVWQVGHRTHCKCKNFLSLSIFEKNENPNPCTVLIEDLGETTLCAPACMHACMRDHDAHVSHACTYAVLCWKVVHACKRDIAAFHFEMTRTVSL